jgi:hypothetical protein
MKGERPHTSIGLCQEMFPCPQLPISQFNPGSFINDPANFEKISGAEPARGIEIALKYSF